jgi:predicted dithiol-disulfide oxidoreductase (DUF899 family)
MIKRFLLILLAFLFVVSCNGNTTTPVVDEGAQARNEMTALFGKMEQSWNARNWSTYNSVFHKDLKAKYVNSDGSTGYWDYSKYTSTAPDRRERIGMMYVKNLKIMSFSKTLIKVEVTLERGGKDAINVFNVINDGGTWRIISND